MHEKPPLAVCPLCGKPSFNYDAIGKSGHKNRDQVKCKGVFISAMAPNDWEPCPSCDKKGCVDCDYSGWAFVRKLF